MKSEKRHSHNPEYPLTEPVCPACEDGGTVLSTLVENAIEKLRAQGRPAEEIERFAEEIERHLTEAFGPEGEG